MAIKKWVLDPAHTQIEFKVKHMMISTVTGSFSEYDGNVETEGEDFMKAKVDFSVVVASLTTGNAERDAHLKGPDFFDVAKFPISTFVITKVAPADSGRVNVSGNLTIKGETRNITFPAKIELDENTLKGKANFDIDRTQWKMNYGNDKTLGDKFISETVNIELDIEAKRL